MSKSKWIAALNNELCNWIDEDEKKLSLLDMQKFEEEGMFHKTLIEHHYYKVLLDIMGPGWHVVPNPRKNEATNVRWLCYFP